MKTETSFYDQDIDEYPIKELLTFEYHSLLPVIQKFVEKINVLADLRIFLIYHAHADFSSGCKKLIYRGYAGKSFADFFKNYVVKTDKPFFAILVDINSNKLFHKLVWNYSKEEHKVFTDPNNDYIKSISHICKTESLLYEMVPDNFSLPSEKNQRHWSWLVKFQTLRNTITDTMRLKYGRTYGENAVIHLMDVFFDSSQNEFDAYSSDHKLAEEIESKKLIDTLNKLNINFLSYFDSKTSKHEKYIFKKSQGEYIPDLFESMIDDNTAFVTLSIFKRSITGSYKSICTCILSVIKTERNNYQFFKENKGNMFVYPNAWNRYDYPVTPANSDFINELQLVKKIEENYDSKSFFFWLYQTIQVEKNLESLNIKLERMVRYVIDDSLLLGYMKSIFFDSGKYFDVMDNKYVTLLDGKEKNIVAYYNNQEEKDAALGIKNTEIKNVLSLFYDQFKSISKKTSVVRMFVKKNGLVDTSDGFIFKLNSEKKSHVDKVEEIEIKDHNTLPDLFLDVDLARSPNPFKREMIKQDNILPNELGSTLERYYSENKEIISQVVYLFNKNGLFISTAIRTNKENINYSLLNTAAVVQDLDAFLFRVGKKQKYVTDFYFSGKKINETLFDKAGEEVRIPLDVENIVHFNSVTLLDVSNDINIYKEYYLILDDFAYIIRPVNFQQPFQTIPSTYSISPTLLPSVSSLPPVSTIETGIKTLSLIDDRNYFVKKSKGSLPLLFDAYNVLVFLKSPFIVDSSNEFKILVGEDTIKFALKTDNNKFEGSQIEFYIYQVTESYEITTTGEKKGFFIFDDRIGRYIFQEKMQFIVKNSKGPLPLIFDDELRFSKKAFEIKSRDDLQKVFVHGETTQFALQITSGLDIDFETVRTFNVFKVKKDQYNLRKTNTKKKYNVKKLNEQVYLFTEKRN